MKLKKQLQLACSYNIFAPDVQVKITPPYILSGGHLIQAHNTVRIFTRQQGCILVGLGA